MRVNDAVLSLTTLAVEWTQWGITTGFSDTQFIFLENQEPFLCPAACERR